MADCLNDVESFRLWATSLGCPPDCIPSEEALKSVFKSRQRDFFLTLMKRVRPREEVAALRQYILLKEVENLNNQFDCLSASRRSFLPEHLKTYLKIKELEKKRQTGEQQLDEYKKEHDSMTMTLKTKNIQIINAKHKNDILQAKIDLMYLKKESLQKEIQKEEKIKEQLLKNMPVKLSAKTANESTAYQAVKQAFEELETFYNFCRKNNDPVSLQQAKDELWCKIRNLFSNVPNFLLFNCILRLKEQQLQSVRDLNRSKLEDSRLRSFSMKEPMSPFEKEFRKAKIDFLGLVVNYDAARKEREQVEENFCKKYIQFVDKFRNKVLEYNPNENDDRIDEIISDYMEQLNLCTYFKSENECMQKQIHKCQMEIEQRSKKLQDHEHLLDFVQKTYSEINTSINTVQHDVLQLGQIKQKILYARNLLKHKSNDVQSKLKSSNEVFSYGTLNTTSKQITTTVIGGSGDSFENGSENVFCSTKLDLELSMSMLNTSLMSRSFNLGDVTLIGSSEPRSILPPHSLELNTFAEIPLENLSCITKECAFYLAQNPLVIDSRELSSILQLAPGTLFTPHFALQDVYNRILWAELISKHLSDLKLDLKLAAVDVQSCKDRSKAQHERITELLDKIDVLAITTNRTLQKASKVYSFIIENPLRNFIPASKLFNNQTYAEFETEFKLYYRMVTGNSLD